jgi:membrane fusion protein, multidrug efflux system
MIKPIFLKTGMVSLFGLILFQCTQVKTPEPPEAFEVVHPLVVDTFLYREFVCNIASVRYVEVRSRVKGYLEKIHVDEGKVVSSGQLLFSISTKEYEKELQKTEASYKSSIADLKASEVELKNVKTLLDKGIVSYTELELIQAKVDALKAKVEETDAFREQANLQLGFAKIKAPYGGIINRIPYKMGSLIDEGSMLTTISDNSEVFAYFNISETDYLNMKNSEDAETTKVLLKLADNTPYPYPGKIETIEAEFDQSSGNIAIRARFPNPKETLRHGANGKVLVKRSLKNKLMIPQKSTFEILDKVYVFVIKPDSTLEQLNINPEERIKGYYLLNSGLKSSDMILYEGVENVRQGLKLSPRLVSMDSMLLPIKQVVTDNR